MKKVNIGGGFEKIPGWINSDLPEGESPTYENLPQPEMVVDIDKLPLPLKDNSVDAFRMKDVMIETDHICWMDPGGEGYEHWKRFAKEIERCLKPGGLFIMIEHRDYHKPYDEVLNLIVRQKGPVPDYMNEEPEEYYFEISIYQKEE